jgi:hypothetical protein
MTIGSVSDPDPYSMAAWIRIHIPNADQYPDPRGLKKSQNQGNNAAKRHNQA